MWRITLGRWGEVTTTNLNLFFLFHFIRKPHHCLEQAMIPLQKMTWVSELNTQNPRIESGLKYLSCISRDVSCCFPGFCLFLSFFLLRASPVAHGGSHARSQSYSRQPTPQPEPHQIRDHSSQQRQILNPLSEVRDRTHVPVDASQICSH